MAEAFDKEKAFEKIRDIIVEELGIDDPNTIKPETSLVKDLEADSLYVIEVIMAIEEEFDVEIPDEESVKFNNINDIVAYIASQKE